jgi:HSP20 family protein
MSNMVEPYDAFAPLREAVTRIFDEGLISPERFLVLGRTFPVDILDRPDEYVIEASLPGINPAYVHMTSSGNAITIRVGKPAHPRRDEDGAYIKKERFERHYPELSRTLTLPSKINPDKVSAEYEHGVLTVVVIKDEDTKPHSIPLHVAKQKA